MKKLIAILCLMSVLIVPADANYIPLGNLPIGNASSTGNNDSFPFTNFTSGTTQRILFADMPNIPALANAFAPIGSTVSAIGSIDSQTKSANGAVINGSSLVMQTADATRPGLMSNGSQTFTGAKTFSNTLNFSFLTASQAVVTDSLKNITSLGYGSSNTASTLVERDSSGNFSAATISAVGFNASGLTADQVVMTDLSKNFVSFPSTSGNIPTSIVTRDSNGDFSARIVNAALTGTASGNTTITPSNHAVALSSGSNALSTASPSVTTGVALVSNGTSADPSFGAINLASSSAVTGTLPNANTTATNASTASTIVARDGSSNFSANVITATLNGNASTASTVTTNANLTGPITSVGNATSIASQTGTGNTFAMSASPTFTGTVTSAAFSGPLTGNVTGNVSGNAGTVTTNANLTGPITSVGNATSVASQTGTGSTFVMNTSPTLVTPALGTPSALVGTNITGTASGLTAGAVTTNANLTGPITSVGNATSVASQTGTGSTFAMSASPTFTGTVTYPTPFTLGATSVTSTGTQLNYLNAATGTTGTTSSNLVFSASPTFTGTVTIPSPFTLGSTSVTSTGTQLNYLNAATGTTGTGNVAFSASPTFTGTALASALTTSAQVGIGRSPNAFLDVYKTSTTNAFIDIASFSRTNTAGTGEYGLYVANDGGGATGVTRLSATGSNGHNMVLNGSITAESSGTTALIAKSSGLIILPVANTPSSSSAACITGTISWDTSFTYVCVSTNTWKRSALSTF